MPVKELQTKITNKKAVIAILGLGYVGLPLAVSFAKKGFKVLGLDKNKARALRIKSGKNYNEDVSLIDIGRLLKKKTLQVLSDLSAMDKADVVIICVPTPLKSKYAPDISYIVDAVKTIRRHLRKGMLVVLESTTFPGTTEELIKPLLEQSGLKAGKDFYLAFSPERIDPGNKSFPVTKIPKIVGGLGEDAQRLTKTLYEKIISKVHAVSSPRAAEMTKLLENSFRLVNISWVNELAMMCHRLEIDIWEVIEAAKTKPFGFMPFYPSLGVGGHCIPDDPLYLYWKAKHHGISSKFIKLSADTNDNVPHYVAGRLKDILVKQDKRSARARVLVVGATYKKDVKDLRRSSALKFIEVLKKKGFAVDYFDPLVPFLKIGPINLKSVALSAQNIRKSDCVVIAVAHTDVNYRLIAKEAKAIFDLCHVFKSPRKGLYKL